MDNMDKLKQCYEILGVTLGASWDEIKQAYKDSVKVWHPDRFENDARLKEKAQEKIKEINAAYEYISSYFRVYGAPNFSNNAYHQERSQEAPKDVEPDPVAQEKNGIYDEEGNSASETQNLNTNAQSAFKGKPWRRYWARTLDTLLLSFPAGFFFGLLFPQFTSNTLKSGGELVIGIFILPFVILCEACILGGTGTTLGKWLLNIRIVRKEDGRSVTFSEAIKRGVLVWIKGLAFGLPLICLITMGFAAGRIRKQGTASWDDSISAQVSCGNLSGAKVFIAVFSIISLFIFHAIVKSENKHYQRVASKTAAHEQIPAPVPNQTQFSNDANSYSKPNTIIFVVQDDCNDGVDIQYRFFDETNNLVWPSSDMVYTTDKYQKPNTHELSCTPNATICFGATTYTSSPTVYWGLGINNDQVTNISTSCVPCGSVSEKHINFACPADNVNIKQTQNNSFSNKRRIKSNPEAHEPPPPVINNSATTSSITRQGYKTYEANDNGLKELPQPTARKPIEFSDLSPSQKQNLELACFEARTKGQLQFDECIKAKLSASK